ncbi:MAG: restriction endonuclease [Barnesiella sp.]|nr:restriction endonuclease [Barnesiella sp.]
MNPLHNFMPDVARAITLFWETKDRQLKYSVDTSNRGAVVAGKQLDGFIDLLRHIGRSAGIPDECMFDRNNYLPGYFRSSKDWDFLIISPSGNLLVAIELKSQVGSYGNNFNNRAEEAIGTATDFWTAFRENEFPTYGTPCLGYIMLIGDDDKSSAPVRNHCNHYQVLPEFDNASYIDRYRILCEKLMTERLYTCSCLIASSDKSSYRDISDQLSISRFINSLNGYLIGCAGEFNG